MFFIEKIEQEILAILHGIKGQCLPPFVQILSFFADIDRDLLQKKIWQNLLISRKVLSAIFFARLLINIIIYLMYL